MNELKLQIDRNQYERIKANKMDKVQLSSDVIGLIVPPVDFDRVKLSYRSRHLFRNFEGLDKDGVLHVGDTHNRRECFDVGE
jgi:hypothetical protein